MVINKMQLHKCIDALAEDSTENTHVANDMEKTHQSSLNIH